MIGDYSSGDETVLAAGLEVFDLLTNTLAEYETSMSPRATGTAAGAFSNNKSGKEDAEGNVLLRIDEIHCLGVDIAIDAGAEYKPGLSMLSIFCLFTLTCK